jgi:hypothetical protein
MARQRFELGVAPDEGPVGIGTALRVEMHDR